MTLFPAAVRHLDDDDWHAIDLSDAQKDVDSLTHALGDDRFAQLRQVIAAETAAAVHSDGETERRAVHRLPY